MRAALALAALLVVLAPLAAAAPTATASATQAAWQDGAVSGQVLAFRFSAADVGSQLDASSQPVGFHLTGQSVAWANRDADFYAEGPAGFQYLLPHSEQGSFGPAVLSGQERRADGLLYVLPTGPVTVEGSCGSQMQPAEDSVTPPAFTGPATPGADTSHGLAFTTCPAFGVVLRGSFQVVLWEVDALVQTTDGTTLLRTGKLPGGVQDGAPDTRPAASRAREAYLAVENGTFAWTDPTATATVFLADATLTDARSLVLSGATATFPSAGLADVRGERVEVSGVTQATLARQDGAQPVGVAVLGLDAASVDGHQVIAPHTKAVQITNPRLPWLAAVSAILAAAVVLGAWVWVQRPVWAFRAQVATGGATSSVVATTWRERRGVGYRLLASRAHAFRHDRAATLYATLALRLFPDLQEAWVVRALAHEQRRKWRRALADHRHLYETVESASEQAASACHMARLLVRLKDHAAALVSLRAAYDLHPMRTLAFMVSSDYDALSEDAWFKAVRLGHADAVDPSDPSVA